MPRSGVRHGVGSLVRWSTGSCAEPQRDGISLPEQRAGVGTSRACPPRFRELRASYWK